PEALSKGRRIGEARLAEHLGRTDPQKRLLSQSEKKRDKGQRQSARGGRVARLKGMDFGQRRNRHTASERGVQSIRAGCERVLGNPAVSAQDHAAGCRLAGLGQRFGQPSLNPRDLMAQRQKRLPRRGDLRHDVLRKQGICSCYVLIDSRACPKSQADSARIYSSAAAPFGGALVSPVYRFGPKTLETAMPSGYMGRQKDEKWPASTRPATGKTSFPPRSTRWSCSRSRLTPICPKSS